MDDLTWWQRAVFYQIYPRSFADGNGDGQHDDPLARLHLALLLTLKGTPFLYNGEEIGMANLELRELGQLRDTAALGHYRSLTEQLGVPPAEALHVVTQLTRDRCRSPMQWSAAPNAGFSPPGAATWLPVHPNHRQGVSVADQAGAPGSLLEFYRRLLHLRRATPALIAGDYRELLPESETCLAFLRGMGSGEGCLVALNFSPEPQTVSLDLPGREARLLFSSAARDEGTAALGGLALAPFEVLIAALPSADLEGPAA